MKRRIKEQQLLQTKGDKNPAGNKTRRARNHRGTCELNPRTMSVSPLERVHSEQSHEPGRVSVCEPADKETRSEAQNRTGRTAKPGSDERGNPVCVLRFRAGFMSFRHQLGFNLFYFSFIQAACRGAFTVQAGGALCRGGAHRWPSTEVHWVDWYTGKHRTLQITPTGPPVSG